MIALAVLVCSLGTVVVTQMFEQARASRAMARMCWIVLTSVAAGATIWCTHFVSMMGYAANAAVRIDPLLTVFSLMVAVAGTSLGLWVALAGAALRSAAIGGALVGAAAAAMHFLGMAGYRLDGLIHWRLEYVATAPLLAMALAGAALVVLCGERLGRARIPLAAGLLVAGILSMHFTAMTAMEVASFAPDESSANSDDRHALGLATALVGVIAMAASIAAALVDRRTRAEAFRHLRRLAMTDSLTGLTNRPGFNEALTSRLAAAERAGTKLALIAIDLDRFKEVNDLYGHKAGDDVLATLARRMSEHLRAEDLIARLGGDEFVALVECRNREELLVPLGRLEAALTAQVDLEGFAGSVGASIGVAVYPDDALTAETLSTNADLAMYRAKREGASEPCFYDA